MTDIGYWLSGLIALGIVIVGTRSFLAPRAAAAAFWVPVPPDARWEAYLSVKAVRDIASGLLTAIVILNRSAHLLGWFMLVATIIPLTDAAIVLKYGGTKTSAFGIHGATAGVMLIISGILFIGLIGHPGVQVKKACAAHGRAWNPRTKPFLMLAMGKNVQRRGSCASSKTTPPL